MMETIAYPYAPEPRRAYFARLPAAAVNVEQAPDGRWMWGCSYDDREGGFGFSPFEKWGRFAPSRAEAIAAAVDELLSRISRLARFRESGLADRHVVGWLESLRAPRQGDLFGAFQQPAGAA